MCKFRICNHRLIKKKLKKKKRNSFVKNLFFILFYNRSYFLTRFECCGFIYVVLLKSLKSNPLATYCMPNVKSTYIGVVNLIFWNTCTGLIYTYSTGMRQHLYVNQPELVKEMNQCITLGLGKPSYVSKRLAPMLGNGILRSNGHIWAQQRKIVAPEFFMDKVKVLNL